MVMPTYCKPSNAHLILREPFHGRISEMILAKGFAMAVTDTIWLL